MYSVELLRNKGNVKAVVKQLIKLGMISLSCFATIACSDVGFDSAQSQLAVSEVESTSALPHADTNLGLRVYEDHCMSCHGRGDRMAAVRSLDQLKGRMTVTMATSKK